MMKLLLVGFIFVLSFCLIKDVTACNVINNTFNDISYSGSGLDGFYSIATSFLDVLHPKTVPYDKIKSLIDAINNGEISSIKSIWNNIQPLVKEQAGLLACIAFGILFIVVTPIVGMIFCCCRLCGNCGGKRKQKSPNTVCFVVLLILLTICLAFMLTGIIIYSISTSKIYNDVQHSLNDFRSVSENLMSFFSTAAHNILCDVIGIFKSAMTDATNILTSLGLTVTALLEGLTPFKALKNLEISMNSFDSLNSKFQSNLTNFQSNTASLETNFDTLHNTAEKLPNHTTINFSQVSKELTGMNQILGEIQKQVKSYKTLSDPNFGKTFANEIKNALKTKDSDLNQVKDEIQSNANDLLQLVLQANSTVNSALDELDNVVADIDVMFGNFTNGTLNDVQSEMSKFVSDFKWVKYTGIIIAAPMILSIALILSGCCLGSIFYKSVKPSKRNAGSNCGGNCLMASVGFLFIFGWIYMLITLVLFVLGYSAQYVCQPVFYDTSLKFYSFLNQYYIPNITLENSGNYTFNLVKAIQGCQADQTIYSALQLDTTVEPLLNQGRQQISNAMNKIPVNTFTDLITTELVYKLQPDLNETLGEKLNSLTTIQNYLSSSILMNVLNKNNFKETLGAILQYNSFNTTHYYPAFAKQLGITNEAYLNVIRSQSELETNVQALKFWFQNVIKDLNTARTMDASPYNVIQTVKSNATALVTLVNTTAQSYMNTLQNTLEIDVGKCGVVYKSWQNVGTILCKELGYPIHGTWAGMGLVLLLLIPMIIVCVRLAKYFRKMKKERENDYENHPTFRNNRVHSYEQVMAERSAYRPYQPPPAYVRSSHRTEKEYRI